MSRNTPLLPQEAPVLLPLDGSMLEQVAALERLCFSDPWSLASLESELTNPAAWYCAACLPDGTVAGYCGLHSILDEGYITNVAVHPTLRRRGIASLLLDALLTHGQEDGLSFLTLEVRESNAPAISLYRRYGFRECGCRRNYYQRPREDALIMTRYL